MRVIAGRLRGRRVDAPKGAAVRPTYDRVRESVFSIIEPRLPGASVLDLFAGSGILGIECLSRGARAATFVEADRNVLALLGKNVERFGLGGRCDLSRGDALGFVGRSACGRVFDIVFVDPPYGVGLDEEALALLGAWDGLTPGGLVVAEHETGARLAESYGRLVRVKRKRYGGIEVEFFEVRGGDAAEKEEA